MLCQPWMALIQRQPVDMPRLSASSHVSAANTLMLLIRASATVTVYRGHRQTLFLSGVISLFVMCVGIIRNNSLVGGRARAEAWATERVTLYCTWRPSALTTGPYEQVWCISSLLKNYLAYATCMPRGLCFVHSLLRAEIQRRISAHNNKQTNERMNECISILGTNCTVT